MSHATVDKNVITGSVKRQKESEKKNISDRQPTIVQQVDTLAEALGMPPEVFEQLLGAGPKCSSLHFLFVF